MKSCLRKDAVPRPGDHPLEQYLCSQSLFARSDPSCRANADSREKAAPDPANIGGGSSTNCAFYPFFKKGDYSCLTLELPNSYRIVASDEISDRIGPARPTGAPGGDDLGSKHPRRRMLKKESWAGFRKRIPQHNDRTLTEQQRTA